MKEFRQRYAHTSKHTHTRERERERERERDSFSRYFVPEFFHDTEWPRKEIERYLHRLVRVAGAVERQKKNKTKKH